MQISGIPGGGETIIELKTENNSLELKEDFSVQIKNFNLQV